ncbi:hypothetical protein GLOIN_2v1590969 [Rhizophagus clarus]|uniref:Uncharacterized protein n=1 Tax=Rhizophagus clarus TaxID=94130 RepID=A0A8H3LQF3_9GLOM|nr:hypothetical protein GLOIN_2v1590969 [Rhizophagus clarus]
MVNDPPKLSVTLEENKSSPNDIKIINEYGQILQSSAYGNCIFFNGTLLPDLNFNNGGAYSLEFESNDSGIVFFIGDTDSEMNWNLTIPQGNNLSDPSIIDDPPVNTSNDNGKQTIGINILTPRTVTKQVEEPSLTLADVFSNVGGYLSIWGIFAFFFGCSKMDPFEFVSRFVFIKQDMAKLLKELEKKRDRSANLNFLEGGGKCIDGVTETSNLNNQTGFKVLLENYYVETDYYKHAVKPADV